MADPSSSAYLVNCTRWPLVYARPPAEDTAGADQAFRSFYAELDGALAKRRAFVMLVDLRGISPSISRAERFLAWTQRQDKTLSTFMVAMAHVVTATHEREYVTNTYWMMSRPLHTRMIANPADAERWLLTEYQRHEAVSWC